MSRLQSHRRKGLFIDIDDDPREGGAKEFATSPVPHAQHMHSDVHGAGGVWEIQ